MGLKEPFNSISHMVGGGLSIAGTAVLLVIADTPMQYVAASLYGFGLIALYTMSSLYHGISGEQGSDSWLERLDHVAIYLLIAGTYTPLCLLVLPPAWGWSLLGAVWLIGAAGIVLALTVPLGPAWLHPVGYIVLSWVAVLVAPVLFAALAGPALWWLFAGGITYTGGAVFYVLDHRVGIVHTHHVWHMLVMAGSVAHYVLVAVYIL